MTLRELVLLMSGNEKLMIRFIGEGELLETTPDEIINDYEKLHDVSVVHIWTSYNLYKAIMIDVDNPQDPR